MATTNLIFGTVGNDGPQRPPVLKGRISENITPSGSNQVSTNKGFADTGGASQVVQITTDVDIWVAIGQSPQATTSSMLILGGQTRDFFIELNDKVAVLEASL